MTFHIHSATRFQMDSYIVSNTNLAPVRAIHSKRYCPVLGFDFRDEYTSWSILMFRSHSTVLETSTFFFPRQRRRCGEGHGACARADVVHESDCIIHGRKMCTHLSRVSLRSMLMPHSLHAGTSQMIRKLTSQCWSPRNTSGLRFM